MQVHLIDFHQVYFFYFLPTIFPQLINHSIWIHDINYFIGSLGSTKPGKLRSYRNLSGLGQLNVLTGLLFIIPLRGLIKACFILPVQWAWCIYPRSGICICFIFFNATCPPTFWHYAWPSCFCLC